MVDYIQILLSEKKVTINFINKNENNCFQYAATAALNIEKSGKKY